MSSISKIWRKLRNKEYRDGYTEAQLSIEVPFQIRAIRKARGWTQAQLAEQSGIPQARISHIEQPGRDPLSLRTLYRLAAAFDVGLLVQFVSFSELVRREAAFDPETFRVPSFAEDYIERNERTADTVPVEYSATALKIEIKVQFAESVQIRDLSLQLPEPQILNMSLASTAYSNKPIERTPYEYKAQATG
ncbi:MAG: helix-turn-helix transcriptional regulator [Candidatus Latescibacteria bacterium]|nr:helix-turn-helix transcriptional regulator [Candidatus Latescibacterota bacterium]